MNRFTELMAMVAVVVNYSAAHAAEKSDPAELQPAPAAYVSMAADEWTKHLDHLDSSGGERNTAIKALQDADSEIVVPVLIERLTRNVETGHGTQSRMLHHALGDEIMAWIRLPSENEVLAELLVKHRAVESAVVIQSALDLAMKRDSGPDGTLTRALAEAVYKLSGNKPEYWDVNEKKVRPLQPSVYLEETMREILRPDRTPTGGLTATFAIHGKAVRGEYILATERITFHLELKNHTDAPIALDLTPKSFTFEYTRHNQRFSIPGDRMPEPRFVLGEEDVPAYTELGPNHSIIVTWTGAAREMPFVEDLATEYHRFRVSYAPATDTPVISNSVRRRYIRDIE